MSKPRKSGIDILGDLPWSSHLCLFYETKQDRLDALIPFFKAGLENNEFIIWVIPDPSLASEEEAMALLKEAVPGLRRHLGNGQIEILHEPDWYLLEKEFDGEEIIKAWNDKLKGAYREITGGQATKDQASGHALPGGCFVGRCRPDPCQNPGRNPEDNRAGIPAPLRHYIQRLVWWGQTRFPRIGYCR